MRTDRPAAVAAAAAAVVALVVALVVAVPRVVARVWGQSPPGHGLAGTGSAAVDVPDGWRVESWGDVTWAVPDGWGHGTIDQWCVGRHRSEQHPGTPVVERPYGISTLVLCHPFNGLGVSVSPDGPAPQVRPARYVAGAAVGQRRVGDVVLTVSTSDRALTDRVLASARRYAGLDPNGCPPTAEAVPVAEAAGRASAGVGGQLSVCRYTWEGTGSPSRSVLAQSDQLSVADSRRAWRALQHAPVGTGPDASADECEGNPLQVVLLRTAQADVAWVWYDACAGHGVALLGEGPRRLTEDVLYWAVIPGWDGSWVNPVPMPRRFR